MSLKDVVRITEYSFKPYFKNSSLSPYFGAYPFFKPPFAALRTPHLYES